jgi:ubiquinone biosynthesis protein UbiJ
VLDWWQTVLDETKDLVDDSIDRFRDDDAEDELSDDIAELKKAVADLNAKLDRLVAERK